MYFCGVTLCWASNSILNWGYFKRFLDMQICCSLMKGVPNRVFGTGSLWESPHIRGILNQFSNYLNIKSF